MQSNPTERNPMYSIKCDSCKTEIGRTDSIRESAAGGRCADCNPASLQSLIESEYEHLKLVDRISPGRTPWQTLRKRAEDIVAAKFITEMEDACWPTLTADLTQAQYDALTGREHAAVTHLLQEVEAGTTHPASSMFDLTPSELADEYGL